MGEPGGLLSMGLYRVRLDWSNLAAAAVAEVVKQEMASVNTDILGISELNGLEWVNWTQMRIVSTTVGKNPLEEMK